MQQWEESTVFRQQDRMYPMRGHFLPFRCASRASCHGNHNPEPHDTRESITRPSLPATTFISIGPIMTKHSVNALRNRGRMGKDPSPDHACECYFPETCTPSESGCMGQVIWPLLPTVMCVSSLDVGFLREPLPPHEATWTGKPPPPAVTCMLHFMESKA